MMVNDLQILSTAEASDLVKCVVSTVAFFHSREKSREQF